MTEVTEAYEWSGRDVVASDGDKIGTLEEIYLDTDSGEPEWATVKTGLFGTKQSFVPLAEATPSAGNVVVPYDKDQVKDAPSVDPDGELSQRRGGAAVPPLRPRLSAGARHRLPETALRAASRPVEPTSAARPPTTR